MIEPFVNLLRPHQWLKNLILYFPPFLGGVLLKPGLWQKGLLPFAIFCLASSSVYIFNDIRDRESDRNHPDKQHRPVASGAISVPLAIALGATLLLASLALSLTQPLAFCAWLVAYFGVSFAYSLVLKDQPVFDIFCIASGFVFRLFAGGVVFAIEISDWLFLSVLLLAIFLSAGKRLGEKRSLGQLSGVHRRALAAYPERALEGFMLVSAAAVLLTYSMYAITMHRLVYTVPLCCFGLFRYILLIKRGASGDPTDSLIRDPVLFLVGLAWVITVAGAVYL
jgi:4-hydroxybenzoate polyprenyltransferase